MATTLVWLGNAPSMGATLIGVSAAIVLLMGSVHLAYTFFSRKFHCRDPAVNVAMQSGAPRISADTSMWRAWTGFNASHSLGAMLFGLVYLQLALAHSALLAHGSYFALLGAALLSAYAVLAWRYWFRVPLVGITLALGAYIGGLVLLG
jgi:hypothetical protein